METGDRGSTNPQDHGGYRPRQREAIPLNDYQDKSESLKRIHAQSSAETSGLGDSLQRIHALSSTETSGYADTVPSPTAPTPSPEAVYHQRGPAAGDPYHYPRKGHSSRLPAPEQPVSANYQETPMPVYPPQNPNADFEQYFSRQHAAPPRQNHSNQRAAHARPSLSNMDDDEVAAYMDEQGRSTGYGPAETPPLGESDFEYRGPKFLGRRGDSAWLAWSQDRRASFKRKMDSIEKRQQEMDRVRVSTPVRKARKESVMFVSPELEDQHIPGEETSELHDKLADHFPAIKLRKKQEESLKFDGKLSVSQWSSLIAFWEHKLFRRGRYVGIALSFVALVLAVITIVVPKWSIYTDSDGFSVYTGLWTYCVNYTSSPYEKYCDSISDRTFHLGVWENCRYNATLTDDGLHYQVVETCSDSKTPWQTAVIGLLIFAVAFGFLATLLSICGVCTSALAKKVYYYHSAGEIYFICALSMIAALVVYPVAISLDNGIRDHTYGYGYGLGWGATFFYLASAMCMCLDDVVRALTRGVCCKDTSDTRV